MYAIQYPSIWSFSSYLSVVDFYFNFFVFWESLLYNFNSFISEVCFKTWNIVCLVERIYILLLSGRVFYAYQLISLGWLIVSFLHILAFLLSTSSVDELERSVQASKYNCNFLFLILGLTVFASHILVFTHLGLLSLWGKLITL